MLFKGAVKPQPWTTIFFFPQKTYLVRQHSPVIKVLDLKYGDPEFKSHSNHKLYLFQALVPGSTLRLCLYIANRSGIGILNLLSLFRQFVVLLALKSPSGVSSVKYMLWLSFYIFPVQFKFSFVFVYISRHKNKGKLKFVQVITWFRVQFGINKHE